MVDITREEAEQFNDDVQCVIERLKEFTVIYGDEEHSQQVILAAAAIVNQLHLRWFGFEDSLANIERKRYVKNLLAAALSALEETGPPPASSTHPWWKSFPS